MNRLKFIGVIKDFDVKKGGFLSSTDYIITLTNKKKIFVMGENISSEEQSKLENGKSLYYRKKDFWNMYPQYYIKRTRGVKR
jgi:hypothetical protein